MVSVDVVELLEIGLIHVFAVVDLADLGLLLVELLLEWVQVEVFELL